MLAMRAQMAQMTQVVRAFQTNVQQNNRRYGSSLKEGIGKTKTSTSNLTHSKTQAVPPILFSSGSFQIKGLLIHTHTPSNKQ